MTVAAPDRDDLGAHGHGPMVRLAGLLGCTEGQAYTVLLGTVVALVAALLGLPPTLRDVTESAAGGDTAVSAAPAPPPNSDTPAPTGEVAAPPAAGVAAPAAGGEVPGASARVPDAVAAPATPDAPAPSPPSPSDPAAPAAVVPATGFGAAQLAARVGAPGAPDGVAVDGAGRIHVATNNALLRGQPGASKVIRYAPDGRVQRELVVEGQDGARTGGLTGVAIAADGTVLVLDSAPARVLRVDLDGGRQATYASISDLPACGPAAATAACEAGADDRPQPRALVVDATGALFVSDSGQGVIWRVPAGGRPSPWFVFADAAASPTGIALDPTGDLLVATTLSLESSSGGGQLQRIDVRRDGTAGRRTTVAAIDPLSGPLGLTVTPDGGVVVALSTSNVLVLLGPDGTERARLTAEQVEAAVGVPLDGPTGLAVRGRSVVVTNQSPTANDASHWVVFDVPLTP